MEKVENIKRPLKVGEKFLVPCLVKRVTIDDQVNWLDIEDVRPKSKIHIIPVFNNPHNDIESGQKEIHYHIDYRFVKHFNNGVFPTIKNTHTLHIYGEEIRPTKEFGNLEYHVLPVINEEFKGITSPGMISKTKIKNCIHKNKCPHKGYDLSQVPPVNGVITCPLHGLKFDLKTGKRIKS